MNNFSWAKAFGFGLAIWLLMFIIAAILVGLGVALGSGAWIMLAIVAGAFSYLFALGTDSATSGQALAYGAMWVAIGVALDALISRQFQSNLFGLWQYYAGYALILLAPWFDYEMQGSGAHPRPV